MRLVDLANLPWPPEPWSDGGKIPWHEPEFSERMLKEHLTQAHDLASRRSEFIGAAVDWIHRDLLGSVPSRILDLGCGPGLYMERLARLGHTVQGIDFSPASVRHARALTAGLNAEVFLEDLRTADFGEGHDLALFLYGEFGTFPPRVGLDLLRKARRAAQALVLEVRTIEGFLGEEFPGRSWSMHATGGLFSSRPHLLLEEGHLDEELLAATTRFTVIDLEDGTAQVHGHTEQGYRHEDWQRLLAETGWRLVDIRPSLGPQPDPGYQTLVAR